MFFISDEEQLSQAESHRYNQKKYLRMGLMRLRWAGAIVFFVICGGLAARIAIVSERSQTFRQICEWVYQDFYREPAALRSFHRQCVDDSKRFSSICPTASSECMVNRLNRLFALLNVSHLYISEPVESRDIFLHVATDTGIRVRLIDGAFVVSRLLPHSPAEKSGLAVGDQILGRDGFELRTEDQVRQSGRFSVVRGRRQFEVTIKGVEYHEDMRPRLTALDAQTAWLQIPSFEGEFRGEALFARRPWLEVVANLEPYNHVIIDLRGNLGGNFAAMLRGLSPFFCEPTLIGAIEQPRKIGPQTPTVEFPDALESDLQLNALGRYPKIELRTFADYGCYRGRVTVLVDNLTASVSEIFAAAMLERPQARVWGQPTSGSVLVSKREEILRLEPGHVLVIPVASFVTPNGRDLEEDGLQPQNYVFYQLPEALRGQDSWLLRARQTPFKP